MWSPRSEQNKIKLTKSCVSSLVGVHGQQAVLHLRENGNVPQTIKPLTPSPVLQVPKSPWCYSPPFWPTCLTREYTILATT